jgi:putative nucleotidyltransferase with HDIG domain
LNLNAIAARAGDLPVMPATCLKALRMTQDETCSPRELQQVISQDQALSARILRIVNSALYGLSREVATIRHAVALLGLDTIRSIIMAATAQDVLRAGSGRGTDLGTKLLAQHSWAVAVAARIIAHRTRQGNPEEAFIAGLMHDIGKSVLNKNVPDQYSQVLSEVYGGGGISFHEAEMARFGFSHQHVGALVADRWKFPAQLCQAIGFHHSPQEAPDHPQFASVVNLADKFAIVLEIGFLKDPKLELDKQLASEFLNLDKASLDLLVAETRTTLSLMPDPFKY